jgi:hypothetical protein
VAANHPDLALGFEDAVGWSRDAQPQMPAWRADQPLRWVEKAVPAKDPEGTAVACYGLYVPTANRRLGRCVRGRPVRAVTGAWLAVYCAAQGQRALVRIWDKASWPSRQAVQAWINAHNRHAKHAGGCRGRVCR